MSNQTQNQTPAYTLARREKLRTINKAIEGLGVAKLGPRESQAMLVTVPLLFALCFGAAIFTSEHFQRGYAAVGIVVLCTVVFVGVIKFSARPKSWRDVLDATLADYDPVNKVAFLQLQTVTRTEGWDLSAFKNWVTLERMALNNLQNAPEQSRFLDRYLS